MTTTKSQRGREPELFKPIARELVELHLARGEWEAAVAHTAAAEERLRAACGLRRGGFVWPRARRRTP